MPPTAQQASPTIRRSAKVSNETAGEHFTPRDAIKLMVNLLFIEGSEILTPGNPVVRTSYDPTSGNEGMLSVVGEHLTAIAPRCVANRLPLFVQAARLGCRLEPWTALPEEAAPGRAVAACQWRRPEGRPRLDGG